MARQFKKLAHSLYECKYHVVFCPKYRYKILQGEMASYVMQQIYQKDCVEVVEGNVRIDHVSGRINPSELRSIAVHGVFEGQTGFATI